MENQNPDLKNNPENFHPCYYPFSEEVFTTCVTYMLMLYIHTSHFTFYIPFNIFFHS